MEQIGAERPGFISLSQGIPSLPMDQRIVTELIPCIKNNLVDQYTHPQGTESLRRLISEYLSLDGSSYGPHEILVTAGAMEGLSSVFHALFEAGDEILILTPTYASFFNNAHAARLKIQQIPLIATGWKLPFNALERAITKKTRAILLCNPNNPTGSVYSKKDLGKVADIAQRHGLYCIIDEVYDEIYFSRMPIFHLSSDASLKETVITIKSFSKNFSMSGWRIGYIVGSEEVIRRILPFHDSLVNCAPAVSQKAAEIALKNASGILPHVKRIYEKKRLLTERLLRKLSSHLDVVSPQGTYYFFPRIKGCSDSLAFCLDLAKKVGLAVVPGSAFGHGGEGHIRICFGRPDTFIEEGIEKLSVYLQTYA